MCEYNILRDKKGIISQILQLDHIYPGSILLTANLVTLKRENPEPILTAKIIEWRKFIDYFGLSIEAHSSRVKKRTKFVSYWVYTNAFIWKYSYRKATYGQ